MVIQTIADTSKTTRKEVGAKLGHFSLVLLKGSSCNKSIKCSNLNVFSFTSGQISGFFFRLVIFTSAPSITLSSSYNNGVQFSKGLKETVFA